MGYRIHVVLHHWGSDRNGIGLGTDLPSLRMYVSKCLVFQADQCPQIVGFLAAGLVFESSMVNALVYSEDGAKEAAAAGYILLSMVAVSEWQDERPARD